ncbi:MAG: NADH-quinone oxidoreductase subunit J [Anaerolineae bacterium]
MNWVEWVFFVVFGVTAIAGGLGVILSRNAIYSALFMLVNFASTAALYLILGAQFLAMAQVLVYAGAIVVLFIFVVMLIGHARVDDVVVQGRPALAALAAILALAFLGVGAYAVAQSPWAQPAGAPEQGGVQAVGRLLFTEYLLPFELASILLLAGMIGAIILASRTRPPVGEPEE